MPRQDVPYGGALCRLKERIAEIWDELGKKLHSINGVEGDAAGDVKIVSGDAAVVVTSDQVNHEIEIALDSSQLPAASVSSVNGQTGAVVLDASDINVIGGSDVATDLGNLDADLQQAQTDIATEALTRANADSALQTNINTVQASIPAAAATAVANDPTVAQLATDVPGKLDKITSGSSLKAYTHTGATQGETSVVDGTTANSIGIRDANGRMQGADPASGATDKTLTTANWISQTGDSAPNNLMHRAGNETKTGIITLEGNTGGQVVQKTTNAGFDYGGNNSYVPVSYNKVIDRYGNVVLDSNVSSSNNSRYQRTVLRQKVGNDVYELVFDLIINNNGDGTLRLIKTLNGSTVATKIISTL